jgi:hypothetical protein
MITKQSDMKVFHVSSFNDEAHILLDGFSGITKPSGILVPPGVVSPTQNLSQSYLKKYIAKLLQLNGRKNISL